ncbi:hypothetical protein GOP47_0005431 [Adiantum capillus-veneris]|uniref:Uncharacterized protein n=1 Tax=Adiantum capillus-veneris TaxID=13818 RepID=A0A9D4V5T3_ADICA|nr:hypothetical protein GOP47_0005431 [Adiantum capillus-veneris]
MENSSNGISTRNGPYSVSTHRLSSPASSPPLELCMKARSGTEQNNLTARACLYKERTSVIPSERSDVTHRPSPNPDHEDTQRSSKKNRTDNQLMGGSTSDRSWKLEKTARKGFGLERGQVSPSCLQEMPIAHLPTTKKAENSSIQSDHRAQKVADKGRLPAVVGTRLPHKKAFKTMRFLNEVRDCISEKPWYDLGSHMEGRETLGRQSPPKSLQRTDQDGKNYQMKGTLADYGGVAHDFPFILHPALKRARSNREKQGCMKRAIKEIHLQEVTAKVEESRGPGVLEVGGGKTDCRGSNVLEMVQDANASGPKGLADCTHLSEILMTQRVSADEGKGGRTCYHASHEMAQDVLARDNQRAPEMMPDMSGGLWSTDSAVSGGLVATKMSYTVDLLGKAQVTEGHPEIQSTESSKGRDTCKEPLLTVLANPADIQTKHMKGLFAMENSKSEEQLKRAPGLQVNNCEDDIAHKHSGHSSQCLIQEPSKLGPFQLSLAPPGTMMAEGTYASNANTSLMETAGTLQVPAHTQIQSHTQNQSFSQSQALPLSDGCTASLPFSHHNPSCSLNYFSGENYEELSCGGSRHISQGNENVSQRGWPTASAYEDDDRSNQGHETPWATQRASMVGKNIPSEQKAAIILRTANLHTDDHSTRHLIKHKDFPGRSFDQDEGAQHRAVTPREPWSKPLAHTSQICRSVSLSEKHVTAQSDSARGDESKLGGSFGLQEIAAEPIAIMACTIQELPDSFLESLRSLARDLLCNFEKRREFLSLQNLIKNRTDLTENTLLHAQHTQLEILVALKTGEQAFVQVGAKRLTNKVLTEIFLQTRCRNVACQQSLPVDGCECKVCSQKAGFCHECMCVVCSKFDSDNQTCRWLGCDFCMHWCHADCGLRMLHIAPAQSNKGEAGDTEMQYRCVACGHSTELFGFVKNAFHLFAEKWGVETLAKELDCVRRIFHGSQDDRGQQLCRKVEAMLQELDMKVDIAGIRRRMLQYFSDADLDVGKLRKAANKPSTFMHFDKPLDGKAMAVLDSAVLVTPVAANKTVADGRTIMQPCETQSLPEKPVDTVAELHAVQARTRGEVDHIQSMVRLKQVEAKMLQLRADEAHQQARGLQQIIQVKQDKIEGDYISKYAKLKLNEAEEKRRKRFLELQALERAHRDHQSMKLRMEAQIKDLAMRVGRATWQFA